MAYRSRADNRFASANPRAARSGAVALAAALLFVTALFLYSRLAQARIVTVVGSSGSGEATGAVLNDSEEASHLLKRAREAIEREDWKLAIDSLQRIVDLPGDHVLHADDARFESARRHAHRVIAALPAPGLEAYRLLYDGEAKTRFERAVADHDEIALHAIVDRYLLTRYGDDAAVTLAGWWLDEGRPASALAVLTDLKAVYTDSDIPSSVIDAKLAVATALSGQQAAAQKAAEAWNLSSVSSAALREHLTSLREALGKLSPFDAPELHDDWPIAMGTPARAGLMRAVDPDRVSFTPWRMRLGAWRSGPVSDVLELQRTSGLLPTPQLVTDGHVLVLRYENRLMALDVDSFELLWEQEQNAAVNEQVLRAIESRMRMMFPGGRGLPPVPDAARALRERRLLMDDLGASVVLSHGLAITIERDPTRLAQSAIWDARMIAVRRRFGAAMVMGESETPRDTPDALVAYDVRTGKERWRRSKVDDSNDAAAAVQFLGPPVPVRDALMVIYRAGVDLHAAVLNATDGSVLRRVYLCGTNDSTDDPFSSLAVCVADETAYIPTGRGVLIAMDTLTWTIRWAVRYESTYAVGSSGMVVRDDDTSADAWLDTAPIATTNLVLLAPTDGDYLFAFDRVTGEQVWRVERGSHTYLLGADNHFCWMAGPQVTAVDLQTGVRKWKRETGSPSGRGAISGDRIYMPSFDRLAILNRETGEPIDTILTGEGQPALGNLLCWGGSLFSCGVDTLSRFPDMKRSLDHAIAANQRDRSNAAAALRLGWLELLRERPDRTLSVLDAVHVSADGPAARSAASLAHLRIEALLALAEQPSTSTERGEALLTEARRIAVTPTDKVRASLSLAAKWAKIGRTEEAYRAYVELALAPAEATADDSAQPEAAPGDLLIETSPGLRQDVRAIISERLAKLEGSLKDDQRAALTDWLSVELAKAAAEPGDAGITRLRAIAGAGALPEVSLRAAIALGARAQAEERFEEAEYHYLRVVRESTASRLAAIAAEATARLATVYLQPDELHMPLQAEQCIQALESRYAAVPIPAASVQRDAPGMIQGASAAEQLRARVNADVLAAHRSAIDAVRLGAPGDRAYVLQQPDALPLEFRRQRPEAMAETILLLSGWSEVRAQRVADGAMLWPASLRVLDQPSPVAADMTGRVDTVVMMSDIMTERESTPRWRPHPRAVYDGQVMVLHSANGLHAIGMATGLRVWSRRFEPNGDPSTASDLFLSASDGEFLSLDAAGVLSVTPMIDGQRPRWERDVGDRAWAAVRVQGSWVVAVDRALTTATIYRASNGALLGQVQFRQPTEQEGRMVSLAVFDDVLCGPAGTTEVVAMEMATPGVERWRVRCDVDGKPLAVTGLFKPRPDLLGVGCEQGVVMLIDAATGRIVLKAQTGLTAARFYEGAITDGILCVYGAVEGRKEPFQVAALDAQDGHLLWHRDPVSGEFWSQAGSRYPADSTLLQAAENAIPVAKLTVARTSREERARSSGGRSAAPAKLKLTILDKRTGQAIGESPDVDIKDDPLATTIHQVLAWPDRVIVVVGNTYAAFRIGPPKEPGPP